MEEFIYNYIDMSKKNLYKVIYYLEENIFYSENDIWTSKEDLESILNGIVNIYYDNYFLYVKNDFSKIDKYIKFNNKINRKLKTILLSIIDYYESVNKEKYIKEKEGSILYLTILIYLSIILLNSNFDNVDTPKKIEKVINNVIDNFVKIRFRKEKDLSKLIENLKPILENEDKIKNNLDMFNNSKSYNYYVKINKDSNCYKVIYEYEINDLETFDYIDINNVKEKLNIEKKFCDISIDLCYLTLFKALRNGKDINILFPLVKNYSIKKLNESILNDHLKFIIDFKDIDGNYNLINEYIENNMDLFIEINDSFESENYNMFMGIKNIIVPTDFLNKNEKYLEIWKDMGINFIIKDFDVKMIERELIK